MEMSGNISRYRAMIVGEAPGRSEDASGKPFVGRAGDILGHALSDALGMSKKSKFTIHEYKEGKTNFGITNAVKCRPPANRTPAPDEIDACFPYLVAEVDKHNPRVILALGGVALSALLHETGVTQHRGQWWRLGREKNETWVMPTWHPAFVSRQGFRSIVKQQFWDDVQLFVNRARDPRQYGFSQEVN